MRQCTARKSWSIILLQESTLGLEYLYQQSGSQPIHVQEPTEDGGEQDDDENEDEGFEEEIGQFLFT